MTKIEEYAAAMDTYHRRPLYHRAGRFVSAAVVLLQVAVVSRVTWAAGPWLYAAAFGVAYLVADFLNGLAHLWADNNDDYTSPAGPFVAAFHLHHKRPRYTERSVAAIYVLESGSKFWLVGYLALVVGAQELVALPGPVSFGLAAVGILSSVAEVSHYLCHQAEPGRLVVLLQRLRVLLPPAHHAVHHTEDNRRYAFLNGLADPALDLIARRFCLGYADRSDLHSQPYEGPQTENR